MPPHPINSDKLALSELLDRALNKGVVVWGDATISVAGVDLIYVGTQGSAGVGRYRRAPAAGRRRHDAGPLGGRRMIYVYAICDRPELPLPCRNGLNDEALEKVVHRDIAAVVGDCDGASLSNSADEIWRHEEVIEALMEERTVLPARFGTLVPSRDHVGDILRRTYDALVDDLARVRGRVEIGVRFLSAHEEADARDRSCDEPAGTGPGAAFLRARLARARSLRNSRQAEVRAIIEAYEQLARHADASRLDREPSERYGIGAAFLVPRERVASFQSFIAGVANANAGLALLCTGPWPPYSFVGAAAHNSYEERHGV